MIPIVFMLLFLLVSTLFNTWQPELDITGIKSEYIEGDIITYQLSWSADPPVNEVVFTVADKEIRETWTVTPAEHNKQSAFFTLGWEAQDYQYNVTLNNENGQTHKIEGHFKLKPKDIERPSIQLSGIEADYQADSEIHYTVTATDNQALKRVNLSVLNTPVKEVWETTQQNFKRQNRFSTQGWLVNHEYTYILQAIDQAGNSVESKGEFFLKGLDRIRPSGQVVGMAEQYLLGADINYTLAVEDNQELKTIQFIVGDNLEKEIWHISGLQHSQQAMFATQNWEAGEYPYQLIIIDEADNQTIVNGNFTLVTGADTNPPTGFYSGIKAEYISGDEINYSVEAHDDKALASMHFSITGTNVDQQSMLGGTSAVTHQSFSTLDWQAGQYEFAMQIKDKAGNVSERYTGQFTLQAAQADSIVELLAQCEQHVQARRLTRGRSGNAFDCYQQVLQLDANNVAAQAGLRQLERRYQSLAETALRNQQWQRAKSYLSRLQKVNPKAESLSRLQQRLRQAQQASALAKEAATPAPTLPPRSNPPPASRPTSPQSDIVEALRNPRCEELLTKISIGIEPLTAEQTRILKAECR